MARTILFNKPYGVLSSFTDPQGRPTLAGYISIPGVYAAGRLDYDSEGLLLLTDDGELIHRISDPERGLAKQYLAQVEGIVTEAAVEKLRQGVELGDYHTRPAGVELVGAPDFPERTVKPITPHGPTAWLSITLREGKKRQVRHMTAAVGLPTLRLVRVAIGPLTLEGIRPGDWRELTIEEQQILREMRTPVGPRSQPIRRRRGGKAAR
jgi:23S rRNA pseudouridine2457 synthase